MRGSDYGPLSPNRAWRVATLYRYRGLSGFVSLAFNIILIEMFRCCF